MVDLETAKIKAEEFAKKNDLSLVVLFGSQATRKTHKKSDVDLAVMANRVIDFSKKTRMSVEAEPIFKSHRVDVVDLRTSPILLKNRIMEKGVLLYEENPGLFSEFRIYTFKLYVEALPLFDIRNKRVKEFVKSL